MCLYGSVISSNNPIGNGSEHPGIQGGIQLPEQRAGLQALVERGREGQVNSTNIPCVI